MPSPLVHTLANARDWLTDTPLMRLLLAPGLIVCALLLPLPGWALDFGVGLSLALALGMGGLLLAVGSDVAPRELLARLPDDLRRFAVIRFALALALTKAILAGAPSGAALAWLAQHAFGHNAGIALAAVAGLYAVRFVAVRPRLGFSPARTSDGGAWAEELAVISAHREVTSWMRRETIASLVLAVCLLAAGLLAGLGVKQWPLPLALSNLTLLGLAEASVTAFAALLVSWPVGRLLDQVLEAGASAEDDEAAADKAHTPPTTGVAPLTLEVGRELAPQLKRTFPPQLATVRARLAAELGLPLPRVELNVQPALPPRGYRLSVRGQLALIAEVSAPEAASRLAADLELVARAHAAHLLSMETTKTLVDTAAPQHPVVVRQVLERLGLAAVHGVLQGLLREQVSIRDLPGVLESLASFHAGEPTVPLLVEHARRAQAYAICAALAGPTGVIEALELSPSWDEALASYPAQSGAWVDTRAHADALALACRTAAARSLTGAARPVLLAPRRYRPLLAELLQTSFPELAVLSRDEVSPRFTLRLVSLVDRPVSLPPLSFESSRTL